MLMQLSVIAVHTYLCIELLWVGNCTEMAMLCLQNKTQIFFRINSFFL